MSSQHPPPTNLGSRVDTGRTSLYLESTVKILVIGSGGREHALVWRLSQSPEVEKIWCAPGNGGIPDAGQGIAERVAVNSDDVDAMVALAERLKPDLTVVGPEGPLVAGIRDKFEFRGMRLVGPSQRDARLEGSKIFAKEFMDRYGIPTATMYGTFDSPAETIVALDAVDWPVVVKADGLCAGKGVLVAETRAEAEDFIHRVMMKHEVGAGGSRILLERALKGEELSFIVLTDGRSFLPMAPTRDHKRVFDGDRGPNTGGMGAYTVDGMLSAELESVIVDKIVQPTIAGLSEEGIPYSGFLYFGLMLTDEGPLVLEYNCRMGDPETEVVMPLLQTDLVALFAAMDNGTLIDANISFDERSCATVMAVSGGYPGDYKKNLRISGLADWRIDNNDSIVFHAGTTQVDDTIVTNGGRVLAVTSYGNNLSEAVAKSKKVLEKISFEGMYYRKDIGYEF